MIAAYLQTLTDALGFDRALAHRVRQEVLDHLCEAVAADPAPDRLAAERRAVVNFGDPHVIAAQFALVALTQRGRRMALAIVTAVAGVFLVMKARLAWYGIMQWPIGDDLRALSETVLTIDRYAFWLAVVIGVGACAYLGTSLSAARAAHCRRFRGFVLLGGAATAALAVSVICDAVLTALRLPGMDLSARSVLPLLSMAVEIACAVFLAVQICRTARRATATAALLDA